MAMKVNVSKISGIDDAILSLNYSKRTITDERREHIRKLVAKCTDSNGFLRGFSNDTPYMQEFNAELDKVIKYGIQHGHGVLLSFIDLTIEVDGLHRAGQDDWDAHAKRFDNRIVRASTRLAKFTGKEKSDFYEGKVITTEEVLKAVNINIGDLALNGVNYTYLEGIGFVREDLENDQDVIRGLYRLEIPCSSITKINYQQMRHVYDMRNEESHAHPEVQELAEAVRNELIVKMPTLGYMLGRVWGVNLVKSSGGYGGEAEFGYVEKTRTTVISQAVLNELLEARGVR